MTAIEFKPVQHADIPLLRSWLNKPHWREWWGDPDTELDYIIDMVDGRDTTKPFIFHIDGKPAGYIQYWFIGQHQTEEWAKDNPWLLELPAEAVGVDISIGDVENLSIGIGTTVLHAFVSKLVSDGYTCIIIDPDPENTRAVRAYEKAGFKPIPHLIGQTPGVLIMQYEISFKEKAL
jgi:RimJ/RimL family protein N-acetyltransferase